MREVFTVIIKSVAFNELDPDQKNLWEHASKRPNFSGYIKRLIQRDMESGQIIPQEQKVDNSVFMKGLI